jgi:hypothetical protein
MKSYAKLAGFTEEEALIEIGPRPGFNQIVLAKYFHKITNHFVTIR